MKKIFTAAIAAFLVIILCGCGDKLPENTVLSASDMPGKTVGVLRDSAAAGYLEPFSGTMTISCYDDVETMTAALKNGSIDCAISDEDTFSQMAKLSSSLTTIDEPFINRSYSMAVSADNKELLENLNTALVALMDDGTIGNIISGWKAGEYSPDIISDDTLTKVTVAVDPTFSPYAFYDDVGELRGLEIDIVRAVCAKLGLYPEFSAVNTDKLVYMAESGKVSFAVGRIVNDPENAGVSYTQQYLSSVQEIVVRK